MVGKRGTAMNKMMTFDKLSALICELRRAFHSAVREAKQFGKPYRVMIGGAVNEFGPVGYAGVDYCDDKSVIPHVREFIDKAFMVLYVREDGMWFVERTTLWPADEDALLRYLPQDRMVMGLVYGVHHSTDDEGVPTMEKIVAKECRALAVNAPNPEAKAKNNVGIPEWLDVPKAREMVVIDPPKEVYPHVCKMTIGGPVGISTVINQSACLPRPLTPEQARAVADGIGKAFSRVAAAAREFGLMKQLDTPFEARISNPVKPAAELWWQKSDREAAEKRNELVRSHQELRKFLRGES
jgi:hypothetical protein